MIKKQPKESLADKIAGVLSAVPATFDPEEEALDDTSAKVTHFEENDEDDEELLSKFRKQNVDLLADIDTKYAGKKGNRKNVYNSESDEFSENEDSESKDGDLNVSEENTSLNALEESNSDVQSESTNSSVDQNSEDENEDSLSINDDNEEDNSNFLHMRDTNLSLQVKKGLSVRNQMSIWENLLEMRIQLQKCLLAANKMPQGEYYKKIININDSEADFSTKIHETKSNLGNVLDKLITLQNLVIKKFPETKDLGRKGKKDDNTDDLMNEEIASDTEEENGEDVDEEEEIGQKKKKRKLNDYENDMSNLFSRYKSYRNDVIEKWNTKTRLSVTRNSGPAHSVVNQIEHILSDKPKLLKRTQLKRTEYEILSGENTEQQEHSEDTLTTDNTNKQVEEYNKEIFDDNDFYHQLLRELIEVKSVDITDPVQLGRQWIQLQNLRSKMKRKIDTRATKGRKIRYAVHSKLVNFMAPFENELWTKEAKNELYSSLFGKILSKSNV